MAKTKAGSLLRLLSICGIAALACGSCSTPTDRIVGKVVAKEGAATAGPSSADRRTLRRGAPILPGDRLVTDTTGRVEIEFHDGIRLTVGPSTDLKIRSYFLGADRPLAGIIDLFEGAVGAEVPGTVRVTLDFQTNTAAISGRHAVWTLIAEEENTLSAVHTGTVQAQKLDIGRGPVGSVVTAEASFIVEIPAIGPVIRRKPRETEFEVLGSRLAVAKPE